jgi:hypothetical protein
MLIKCEMFESENKLDDISEVIWMSTKTPICDFLFDNIHNQIPISFIFKNLGRMEYASSN